MAGPWTTTTSTTTCEPFSLSANLPLEQWLIQAEPRTSGYALLAGNASAHVPALECRLRSAGRPELQALTSSASWHHLRCEDGCPSLLDDVARAVHERAGRWSVVLVHAAEQTSAQPLQSSPQP